MRNEGGSGERTWSVLHSWQFVLNKKGFSFNMNYHELNMNYSSYLLYHCPVRFLCLFMVSVYLILRLYQIILDLPDRRCPYQSLSSLCLEKLPPLEKIVHRLLFSKCGRYFEKYELPMKKCERFFEKYARPMKKCERLFEKYARSMKKCERLFEKYARPMKKCGRLFEKYARPMKKCERLFEKYARPGITFSRELNMKECLVHH